VIPIADVSLVSYDVSVTVINDTTTNLFCAAYLDSIDLDNLAQNYLADAGLSALSDLGRTVTFSFTVPENKSCCWYL